MDILKISFHRYLKIEFLNSHGISPLIHASYMEYKLWLIIHLLVDCKAYLYAFHICTAVILLQAHIFAYPSLLSIIIYVFSSNKTIKTCLPLPVYTYLTCFLNLQFLFVYGHIVAEKGRTKFLKNKESGLKLLGKGLKTSCNIFITGENYRK